MRGRGPRAVRRTAAAVVVAMLVTLLAEIAGASQAAAMVPPSGSSLPTGTVVTGLGAKPVYVLPPHSGSGRRVVYSQRSMHVWAIDAKGRVVRDWKVSGRRDWPNSGTYHVFSKSLWSRSSTIDVGFRWMVRFAHGHTTNIGFHNIPYDGAGRPIQSTKQLGHPVAGGGCVRSADKDAHWLYEWAAVGTKVVVIR